MMPYNPKRVRRRKVLITNNILHKQGAGPTPEYRKHRNPASRKVMLSNPKAKETKDGSNNQQHLA
jgi:hypothetical protein